MKKWQVKQNNENAIQQFVKMTGLSPLVSTIAVSRGIDTKEKADDFFLDIPLSDPFLIDDMQKAVDLIEEHLENGEKITIFGDYDCDGVTGVVILYQYLSALGAEVDWYIPSRQEGYGMNEEAIRQLHKNGTRLIITVDNGISAVREIALAKELGMMVVLTDHHQVPDILPPADAIVNPHRSAENSPYRDLAGCGVALKLVLALEGGDTSVIDQFAEVAAIGTVADIVPLKGENRTIVKLGLDNLQNTDNIGLLKLLAHSKVDVENLSATSLAFTIAPRINAAGRFSHARDAVELLLCENEELADAKAQNLSELNTARQKSELDILKSAEEQLASNPSLLHERILIVSGENWHHGVIGIVSSRLLTKYDKPCLVISIEGDEARGSARSIEGYSLFNMLCECDGYLEKYGGHTKAAGFSLKTQNLDSFIKAVQSYSREKFPVMPRATMYIDKVLTPEDLQISSVEQLSLLEPYGEANPAPVFLMENCKVLAIRPLKDGKYLSFTVDFHGKQQKVLCFTMKFSDFWFDVGDSVDILVTLGLNEYKGVLGVSAQLKDIRRTGFNEERYIAAQNTYEKLARGENIDNRLLRRIVPESEHIKAVYDIIRKTSKLHAIFDISAQKGINYCMASVILDVLEEFNLVRIDREMAEVVLVPAKGKADLTKSVYIEKLKSLG